MADHSDIEWTEATWPIVQGCSYDSPGCKHCYAVPFIWRQMHHPNPAISGPVQGLVEKSGEHLVWTGKVALREDRLDWPLRWKEPRKIFVPSLGDLFHEDVPDAFLDKVFAVMALCQQHTFQVLTKRSRRMREYFDHDHREVHIGVALGNMLDGDWIWSDGKRFRPAIERLIDIAHGQPINGQYEDLLPLPNVWLGVSCEDQERADERIPDLLATPAAVRFISAEPLLGLIDLNSTLGGTLWVGGQRGCDGMHHGIGTPECPRELHHHHDERCGRGLDWVIVGGESSNDARPMHPDWARALRDQCAAAGVPFFFKQWGAWHPDGQLWPDGTHSLAEGDMIGFGKVGKKRAGRLLDGVEHNGMPS